MTLPDIYLHHYPNSPFAEKVRAIFGFKNIAWKSVFQPAVMPKPDLITLTGGYRRIPVLQVGNDVVCDTALICDVLEHLQPAPTLYPSTQGQTSKGAERIIAQWADTTLFAAAMPIASAPRGPNIFLPASRPTPPRYLPTTAKPCAVVRRACTQQTLPPPTRAICDALPAWWTTNPLCWVRRPP
jgi:glutathione S-transferase